MHKSTIASFAALALTACAGDADLDGRQPDPQIGGVFSTGSWKVTAFDTEAPDDVPLLVGVRDGGGSPEVALIVGNGGGAVIPARQVGDALVVEAISLRSYRGAPSPCWHVTYEIDRLALRLAGDTIEGEASGSREIFDGDTFETYDFEASFSGAAMDAEPTKLFPDAGIWLSPSGALGTSLDLPVQLPERATISADGTPIEARLEGGGAFSRHLRLVPTAALPWGASIEVTVPVEGIAGEEHLLHFSTETVAEPADDPAPDLTSLGGYATAGLEPLAPADADELLGRAGGVLGYAINPWVLAFEATVPDTASPTLAVDLLHVGDDEGNGVDRQRVSVVVATASERIEQPLAPGAGDRAAPASSRWNHVEAPNIEAIDLAAFRGERVFVSLSGVADGSACTPWAGSVADVVLERVEILP